MPPSAANLARQEFLNATSGPLYRILRGQSVPASVRTGWVEPKLVWVRSGTNNKWHRTDYAAATWHHDKIRLGVMSACGTVLLSAKFHPNVPDDRYCDPCLMDGYAPYVVYRAFDADGALLYVGCSGDVHKRIADHRKWAEWRHDAVRWTYQLYPDERSALAAEAAAITAEDPIYNRWRPQVAP